MVSTERSTETVLRDIIQQGDCLCLDDEQDSEVLVQALDLALHDFLQGQYSPDKEYVLDSMRYLEWKGECYD